MGDWRVIYTYYDRTYRVDRYSDGTLARAVFEELITKPDTIEGVTLLYKHIEIAKVFHTYPQSNRLT